MKPTDQDYGYDYDDSGEYESVALDWNLLDDMMSALATLKVLEEDAPSVHRLQEERIALDSFEEASKRLPAWLDPFSREVYQWHAIGTVVLDYAKSTRRKEVRF